MIMAETKTNLRLPEELYEQIRVLASKELRSINSQMVVLLQEALEQREQQQRQAQVREVRP